MRRGYPGLIVLFTSFAAFATPTAGQTAQEWSVQGSVLGASFEGDENFEGVTFEFYTQELLRFMRVPGLDVEDVFKQVRISLIERTNGDQTPWESSSLVGDFAFVPSTEPETAAAAAPPSPEPVPAAPIGQPTKVAGQAEEPGRDRAERPPAPGPAQLYEALDACVAVLGEGDVDRFDAMFPAGGPGAGHDEVRDWVSRAIRRSAERGAEVPGGVRLSADGRTATLGTMVNLFWRNAFGGRKSARIPIEATLAYRSGRWQPERYAVAGAVEGLR